MLPTDEVIFLWSQGLRQRSFSSLSETCWDGKIVSERVTEIVFEAWFYVKVP